MPHYVLRLWFFPCEMGVWLIANTCITDFGICWVQRKLFGQSDLGWKRSTREGPTQRKMADVSVWFHLLFCFCCCFVPEALPYCYGSIRRQAVCHHSPSLNPPWSSFRFRFTSHSRVEFLSNIHFTFDMICCKHRVERQGCGKLCVTKLVYIR